MDLGLHVVAMTTNSAAFYLDVLLVDSFSHEHWQRGKTPDRQKLYMLLFLNVEYHIIWNSSMTHINRSHMEVAMVQQLRLFDGKINAFLESWCLWMHRGAAGSRRLIDVIDWSRFSSPSFFAKVSVWSSIGPGDILASEYHYDILRLYFNTQHTAYLNIWTLHKKHFINARTGWQNQ